MLYFCSIYFYINNKNLCFFNNFLYIATMKKCSNCGETKELSEFNKNKYTCRCCDKEYRKKYYKNNKDKIKEYHKKWRENNRDKYNKSKKKWNVNNKQKLSDIQRASYIKNRDIILEKKKAKYQKSIEKYSEERKKKKAEALIRRKIKDREYSKKYYQNNKQYYKDYRKKYEADRKKIDPLFLLSGNLRARTSQAFKRKSWHKGGNTEKLLGVPYEVAKQHIERQFTKGMTWENNGEWHIDHIIPLVSATNEIELRKLCHYTNLQPLWAFDNISKGATMPEAQIRLRI